MASVTMVSVGFSAPPVVNWLPSEMNRLAASWAGPDPRPRRHGLYSAAAGSIIGSAICGNATERWR